MEDLTQMVKEEPTTGPVMFEEGDLDLPDESQIQAEEVADANEAGSTGESINICPLSIWFERESDKFENINEVKVAIRGVDAEKTLIMAVKTGEEAAAGEEAPRNLRVFENADIYPVLDLPATKFEVYNNGFQAIYDYNQQIKIKCYGVRTSLIATFCQNIAGKPIPYVVVRVKKKDEQIQIPSPPDAAQIATKLSAPLDAEAFQLRYKQISKAVADFTTVQNAVDWLLAKQADITDINHHLQIDNVIINTLA